jgi:hypothetical protein
VTDRELLELAAKAAGYEWTGYFGDDEVECQYFDIGLGEEVVPWNPLTDDGDALRLAVKLGLTTAQLITNREVEVNDYDETVLISEFDGPDPYAATRRAIVRAAAEIGRNMP